MLGSGNKGRSKITTSAWVLFVTLTVLVGLLAIVRITALSIHSGWRSDLDSDGGLLFPQECGSWAESDGCTRIELSQDGCVRPKDITTDNSIIID